MSQYKGVIIINPEHNSHIDKKIDRLRSEAEKLDMVLDVITNDGTMAKINKDGSIIIPFICDFVIYLDKDIYFAKVLEQAGYKVFNNSNFLKLCDDKMLTHIALANHGIRMPKTIASPLIYKNEINEENYKFLDSIAQELGYPLVIKRVYGSLGEGVYLAHNIEELRKIYRANFLYPLLFQEYISSSKGRSIRVIVIDGKIIGAIERYNDDDFRSNFGKSNHSKAIKLDEESIDLINKINDVLHIKYAGIDLLYDKDGPVLCEINSNAFFEEFERETGINVAISFLRMIIDNIKKEGN